MGEGEIRKERMGDEDEGRPNRRREFVAEDRRYDDASSGGSSYAMLTAQMEPEPWSRVLRPESVITGIKDLSKGIAIDPDSSRWYRLWTKFILIWAVYSSFFTPMEFGFFRGLPKNLFSLDIAGQAAFCVDIFLQFFVAYRDRKTYRMVYKRKLIALRYLKSGFITDFLSCMPWDLIYKACGRKEVVRYLLWIRLTRVRKVINFFQLMEKDTRINYLFTRIVKLLAVELYCTHTAACFFYHLATTLPPEQEGYTWIGSLTLGDYSYSHFREIDIWKRYTTSLYFAIVTMATVGYGDIHAVNLREMIFIMVYVSFDMILGAYLIGNMTALIVKGSSTERFRDKTTDMLKFMDRNRLGKELRDHIKRHMRLEYESKYTEVAVLQELPISIRAKISQSLYQQYIEVVPLFEGCSSEFINQIVTRVHEEFFLPGEVIMEQGNVVDQLYFVCHGKLEEIKIGIDGSAETASLLVPKSSFGEISVLCSIPQPYTVRVCELCKLLRIDKQSFSNIIDIYFYDGQKILNNLLKAKQSSLQFKQLESEVTVHIAKHEAELALKVNNAAYHGDLYQLKGLTRAGANPKKTDYEGRSPLHLAASRGYEDITLFLIQEGVDINLSDGFGNTPLLEAMRNGHDRVASILVKEGASLQIGDPGSFLCSIVTKGDSEFLKRVLANGLNPNSKDYDQRTPLHIAASGGLYFMAKLLIEYKASVFSKDRWGNTPVDEGRMSGNKNLLKLLEDASSFQLSRFPHGSQDSIDTLRLRKCTVFPFHPWDSKPKELKKYGIVQWVPGSIKELIEEAAKQLKVCEASCLLSEDGGRIVDARLIDDGQRLYLVSETA